MENGHRHLPDKIGPKLLINAAEYVRLIQQGLHKLGYSQVARQLEMESGIKMQPQQATDFQNRIMSGDWSGALQLLPDLSKDADVQKHTKFLIFQQKYLEALEAQDVALALKCLRTELAPLQVNQQQLHQLAGLLLCPNNTDAAGRAGWLGGGRACRAQLFQMLQAQLPPSLMIPDGRLEQLVEQALLSQVAKCQYHDARDMQLSLFTDYKAGIESLPTQLAQVLENHTAEVWQVSFSHNGKMLAPASKVCCCYHAIAMENGHRHLPDKIGPKLLVNAAEYVRLIQQGLHKLGYSQVACQLEMESGIQMQPQQATDFQNRIMSGDWSGALQSLPDLSKDADVQTHTKFLIFQQKYLEALEAQDVALALKCLRTELAPLQVNQQQLLHLAGLLLCPNNTDAAGRAGWLGGGRACRGQLLQMLQAQLPPSLMIPDGRLEQLVEQALLSQVAKCQYHNALDMQLSLFTDYKAGMESLPTQLALVLENHTDEVWQVSFSNNGQMLASASKDGTAIIWQVKPSGFVFPVHTLKEDQPVAYLSWSPDDRMLLTCCGTAVRLWDATTGKLLHSYTHQQEVKACAWHPNSQRFVTGGVDKMIYTFDIHGHEVHKMKRVTVVQDMIITPNGSTLIIAANAKLLHFIRLGGDYREATVQETAPITSVAASRDGEYLLVNLQPHTVHLWSITDITRPFDPVIDPGLDPFDNLPTQYDAEFRANEGKQARFVVRSSFGGSEGTFVVHGSEDCKIYIWHRTTGEKLVELEGHAGTVNSVCWNPRNPFMLASAADDRTIRIWMAEAASSSSAISKMF